MKLIGERLLVGGVGSRGGSLSIDPRLRLVAAGSFCPPSYCLDTWPGLMAAMVIAGLAAIAVGPSWSRLLRRLLAMNGLMLFVLASLPFTVPGEQIFRLGGIEASREGLMQAAVIIARANTILMMILALWDRCRL